MEKNSAVFSLSLYIVLVLLTDIPGFSGVQGSVEDSAKFTCNELLSRPTDNSININLCADQDLEVFAEYGLTKSLYSYQTKVRQFPRMIAFNILLANLRAGTTYYYRVRYRAAGATEYLAKEEHSFTTQRSKGESYSFAIQADPHLDNNTDLQLFKRTLMNILESGCDFMIDLGDNFMSEKEPLINPETILRRHLLLRTFYDLTCHSVPLYLALGNHEGEQGSRLDGTANCLPVWATNIRKQYYPNPMPDAFYSGNSKEEEFVGLRENYYAWEWGDALLVVLDPYWYTLQRQGDNWKFTLGWEQYAWLKAVLETSRAKFKFVFAHQILGGKDSQGRGGSDYAQYFEMGGMNSDSTYGFSEQRESWDLPLHQLMVKNHVDVFFHGHDHLYACQEKDGIIYQEVPQPGYPGNSSTSQAADYGYLTGKILPSSGYLMITLSGSTAKIDYIRSYLPEMETSRKKNRMIEYSYMIKTDDDATAVGIKNELPFKFALLQNFPNPFNPETTISFNLAEAGYVQLDIFNPLGQCVKRVLNEDMSSGPHSVCFNASQLPSGLYFCRLAARSHIEVKKMVCQK
jgi:hypothetical protein